MGNSHSAKKSPSIPLPLSRPHSRNLHVPALKGLTYGHLLHTKNPSQSIIRTTTSLSLFRQVLIPDTQVSGDLQSPALHKIPHCRCQVQPNYSTPTHSGVSARLSLVTLMGLEIVGGVAIVLSLPKPVLLLLALLLVGFVVHPTIRRRRLLFVPASSMERLAVKKFH